MTKYYVDNQGNYIGGFDGSKPPAGAIEVPTAPEDARQLWDGTDWGPKPAPEPDPDETLDDAIRGANNLQELKTALLGRTRGRKT